MDEAKFQQLFDELNDEIDCTETESFIEKCASISESENLSVDEELTENSILKRKICLLEEKCKKFETTNEALAKELYQEKLKLSQMRSKLLFIKENQDVFVQLKEAYANLKYNQSTGKQLAEIKESGAQTYEGILCRACIQTEQIRRSLDNLMNLYEDGILLTKEETERLAKTAYFIREMLQKHDKHYTAIVKKQGDFKDYIKYLEDENETLKGIIKGGKQIESCCSCTNTDSDFTKREVHILKKIVIKLYKRYKQALRLGNIDEKTVKTMELEEKELRLVEQLAQKFAEKLSKKTRPKYDGDCLGMDCNSDE